MDERLEAARSGLFDQGLDARERRLDVGSSIGPPPREKRPRPREPAFRLEDGRADALRQSDRLVRSLAGGVRIAARQVGVGEPRQVLRQPFDHHAAFAGQGHGALEDLDGRPRVAARQERPAEPAEREAERERASVLLGDLDRLLRPHERG